MKIGPVEIKGKAALAPMAGVADRAFRQKTLHALQESGIDGWRPLHPARTSKKEDTAHADARI